MEGVFLSLPHPSCFLLLLREGRKTSGRIYPFEDGLRFSLYGLLIKIRTSLGECRKGQITREVFVLGSLL